MSGDGAEKRGPQLATAGEDYNIETSVIENIPDGTKEVKRHGFRWRSGPPRRHPPGPCQWPRPGHEECACYLGYGPVARLKLEQQRLEERLEALEQTPEERPQVQPPTRTRSQPPRRPSGDAPPRQRAGVEL